MTNDDIKIQLEHARQENQQYMSMFEEYLIKDDIMQKTIERHMKYVHIYLEYCLTFGTKNHLSYGCYNVDSYFEDYIYEEKLISYANDLRNNIVTLNKFYRLMCSYGYISKEDYKVYKELVRDHKERWLYIMDIKKKKAKPKKRKRARRRKKKQ